MKFLLPLLLVMAPVGSAMARAEGPCETGGSVLVSPSVAGGVPATRNFEQSYPRCTVTVYLTGTATLAPTIFSNNTGTPLTNPFTADQFGVWFFYAPDGRYDVQISGGNPPPALAAPYTFGDIQLFDQDSLHINVITRGCVADGVFNNYTCIQTSINAASAAGGGIVFFPATTASYMVNVPLGGVLTVPANVWIAGVGDASLIVWKESAAGAKPLFLFSGSNGGMDSIAVSAQLTMTAAGTSGLDMVEFGTADNLSIRNVHLIGGADTSFNEPNGVQFIGAGANLEITGSTFEQLAYGTYKLNATTTVQRGVRVSNSYFKRNHSDDVNLNSPGGAPSFYQASVVGNTFYQNQHTAGDSTAGFGVTAANIYEITITGNNFDTYQRQCIDVEVSQFVTIGNNTLRSCGLTNYAAIQIISGTTDVSVSGNVIDATANTGTGSAIDVQPGGGSANSRAVVSGNALHLSSTLSGISVFSNTADILVADNLVIGPGTVSGGAYSGGTNNGIDPTSSTHVVISGNIVSGLGVCIGSTNTGSLIGDNETVASNTLTDCNNGIDLDSNGDLVVAGNMIRNSVYPLQIGTNIVNAKTVVATANSAIGCTNAMGIYAPPLALGHYLISNNLDDAHYNQIQHPFSMTFTPSGVGWYRVLTQINQAGGTLEVSADYDNAISDLAIDFNISAFQNPLNGSTLVQRRFSSFNGGVVDRIRASVDGTGGSRNVYIDIHVSTSSVPGPVTLWFTGAPLSLGGFVNPPMQNPTVGTAETETLWLGIGLRSGPGGAPNWQKYVVTKVANGTNGCANANGCWQVGDAVPINASAALTQSVTIANMPVEAFTEAARIQTATAFTGPATANASVGVAGSLTSLIAGPYNLETAVSNTNFSDGFPTIGNSSTATNLLILAITTTGSNVDQIVTGSSVNVWVKWSSLQ